MNKFEKLDRFLGMFTGIIEGLGKIKAVEADNNNLSFWVNSSISSDLKVDQSVSHNGVCLTVEQIVEDCHKITAIEETLLKTTLGKWTVGDIINLERCLQINGRLDGHMVQGHVDDVAECIQVTEKNGSWEYSFAFAEKHAALIIEKGSVCINGISLTAFNVTKNSFCVAIIPYTYNHTSLKFVKEKDCVNIEFDLIGKYILRRAQLLHPV